MFIITHIDKFFHNSPSAARYLGTPHFTDTFLKLPYADLRTLPESLLFPIP